MARLAVAKTYKLFIGGGFPRTESGRSLAIMDRRGRVAAHICRASRKDFRNAVEAAEAAQEGWQSASAYLRGQVIYRMAEMLEGLEMGHSGVADIALGEVEVGELAEVALEEPPAFRLYNPSIAWRHRSSAAGA